MDFCLNFGSNFFEKAAFFIMNTVIKLCATPCTLLLYSEKKHDLYNQIKLPHLRLYFFSR